MHATRDYVEVGGLCAYGASYRGPGAVRAIYVDKCCAGAKARRSSGATADQVRLVINLKTAKALGLNIPPSLLARADEVIE